MAKVYFHRKETDNLVFYVGISVLENTNREYEETNRNKYWHNTVKKHGFIVEIVHNGISEESAKNAEKYYISLLGRKDLKTGCLVNMTNGGQGMNGYKHSNETRNKMKKPKSFRKNTKRKGISEEAKQHLREYNLKVNKQKRIEYFESNININNCDLLIFDKSKNLWEVGIIINKTKFFIGYFIDKNEAYSKYVYYYTKHIINRDKITDIKIYGKTSKYKGVTLDKKTGKWNAQKTVNYKNYNLGKYNSEYEAYLAYINYENRVSRNKTQVLNIKTNEKFPSFKEAAESIGMEYDKFRAQFKPKRKNKTGFIKIERQGVETPRQKLKMKENEES